MAAQRQRAAQFSLKRVAVRAAIGILACTGIHAQTDDRNLARNPSFELAHKGKLIHWSVYEGRAKAQLVLDDAVAHAGKRSLRIVNSAKRAPHVYSHVSQTIEVTPNRQYALSCYVKSDDAGVAWIGGGKGWKRRFMFPRKTQGWQRMVGTFKTAADETSFLVIVLSESPTNALWVDDVQLEVGEKATPFVAVLPLEPGQARLALAPMRQSPNLAPNSSFESVHGNRPEFWMFDERNTDATMTIDDTIAHSGQRSVKLTNGTRFCPQVYGWFGAVKGIAVKPCTPYTVSAYVRSDDPGTAWVGGAQRWRLRCRFVQTDGKWVRVQRSVVTEPDETTIPFMIITESPTKGFWVDDVQLEEGYEATPYRSEDAAQEPQIDLAPRVKRTQQSKGRPVRPYWAPSKYPIRECVFSTGDFRAQGFAYSPSAIPHARVHVQLVRPNGKAVAQADKHMVLDKGAWRVDFAAHLGDAANGPVTLRAALMDRERVLADSSLDLRIYAPAGVEQQAQKVEALAQRLGPLVERLEARGVGAYSRVTLTVLENFVPWAREDLAYGHIDRAWDAAAVMEQMARRQIAEAEAVLAGKRPGMPVPRYAAQPLRIDGPSFLASLEGRPAPRPVFFAGYGHFSQVRNDVEKFPGYGCNMIQIEFGPRSVLPNENEVSDQAIDDFVAVCERAAKAGVAVNLLLSPHYFPAWAKEKWPHLKDCEGGFLKYCVHAPESRAVIEKSLRRVIPRIKDLPALHSLCLSNEPINVKLSKCRFVRKMWHEWLHKKHGSAAALNQCWGTKHRRIDDIGVPDGNAFAPEPMTYDFVCFNQEQFAGFHQWMADVIHEMAPRLPVHAKIMMSAHFHRSLHGVWSVSPELFSGLSQINGNDLCWFYSRRGDHTSGWVRASMALDFQRSMADLPVFNSENHIIVDRDHDVIPPAHVYSALWQAAIHGQSASTIWVWHRTYSYVSSLAGAIIHRPECTEAAGRACLDLNRLAHEVTAIQKAPPQIVLLWSLASIVQGDQHMYEIRPTYEALSFLGVRLGFVTERQLARYAAGRETPLPLRTAKVIVAPGATHVPDSVVSALERFADSGGAVVRVGKCFGLDEYRRERLPVPAVGESLERPDETRDLLRAFEKRLPSWRVTRPVRAIDASGQTAWGVELRSARGPRGWVVNLCNHLREPRTVRLTFDGKPAVGTDLIAGQQADAELVLMPQVPMLITIAGRR